MIESAIWAGVTLYLLWRAELGFKSWLATKEPLRQAQYNELTEKVAKLQSQVNTLSVQREID